MEPPSPPTKTRVRKLPLLIGVTSGMIVGVFLSWLFPPEYAVDKTFYFVVDGGLFASIGLLGGYIWALLATRRIQLLDVLAVALLVLAIAGFFILGDSGGPISTLVFPFSVVTAIVCTVVLFRRVRPPR